VNFYQLFSLNAFIIASGMIAHDGQNGPWFYPIAMIIIGTVCAFMGDKK